MSPQSRIPRLLVVALLAGGAVLGGAGVEYWRSTQASTSSAGQGAAAPNASDIERLKNLVPSQSHSMADVGYHWTNLWFAGERKNWPLAEFYFAEARQHILWTIRIRPVRKDLEQRDVDLQPLFDAVDSTLLAAVKIAIMQRDPVKFAAAYKGALEGCYACHKASGKPFLRPVMPRAPAQDIIDFGSDAAVGP